eukprot:jgi/Chlat1/6920/Chrsp52S06593
MSRAADALARVLLSFLHWAFVCWQVALWAASEVSLWLLPFPSWLPWKEPAAAASGAYHRDLRWCKLRRQRGGSGVAPERPTRLAAVLDHQAAIGPVHNLIKLAAWCNSAGFTHLFLYDAAGILKQRTGELSLGLASFKNMQEHSRGRVGSNSHPQALQDGDGAIRVHMRHIPVGEESYHQDGAASAPGGSGSHKLADGNYATACDMFSADSLRLRLSTSNGNGHARCEHICAAYAQPAKPSLEVGVFSGVDGKQAIVDAVAQLANDRSLEEISQETLESRLDDAGMWEVCTTIQSVISTALYGNIR